MQEVTVYGTTWSVASWDVRRLLESIHVPYQFVDIDADQESRAWVKSLANGAEGLALPVVRLVDGTLLIGATRREVAAQFGFRLDTGYLKPLARGRGFFSSLP